MKGKGIEDVQQLQPNPLRRELERGGPTEAHPFEDVLAAFAENALRDRERGRVAEHLSRCKQCREVLGLATAALPEMAVQAGPQGRPVRPPLRSWLPWVAVAAGLVVSAAVVVHQRIGQLTERAAESGTTTPLREQQPRTATSEQGESDGPLSARTPALDAAAASGLGNGSSGADVRSHWRISAAGQAERSLGSGTWQTVVPDARARIRVISVFGSNVWLGTESARLYHSRDGGTTWLVVRLPNKGVGPLAVTHIRFQGELEGTVQSIDGTQWTTADGGQTWK